MKIQQYKKDMNNVKAHRSSEGMEEKLKNLKEKLYLASKREANYIKELENKEKENESLIAKMETKNRRLEILREINRKLEAGMTQLINKKSYFDEVMEKTNDTMKVISEVVEKNKQLEITANENASKLVDSEINIDKLVKENTLLKSQINDLKEERKKSVKFDNSKKDTDNITSKGNSPIKRSIDLTFKQSI